MKTNTKFIPFFLLTIILSCSNNSEIEKENKELIGQNNALKDSIEILKSRPDFSGYPDSLRIDTTSGFFGTLYSDTLILSAEYADCGEWGGHRETLKIYIDKGLTKAIFVYDSVDCRFQNEGKKYFRTENTVFIINENLQQEIIYYLFDLNRMAFLEQEMYSNAANGFSAFIKQGLDIPQLFNYGISFYDLSFNWNHFDRLRYKIETTANKS